jgi:two-component system nitrate/nitrite response regulator NarL
MPQATSVHGRRAEAAVSPRERPDDIGLVLAESYPMLLEGMQRALDSEPGFKVLASCADGDEAVRAVGRHHPDVLMLDLAIPGKNALQVLKEVASEHPATRVIVLAANLDEHEMLEAMRLGAKGILLKNMARHLLVQCVRKVHRGATWIEKVSMGRAVEHLLRQQAGYRATAQMLSGREFEVLRAVVSGKSNKEIADTLGISEGTIKVHLHRVYEKLGVKGRLELALYAHDKGLLPSMFADRFPKSVK